jgi:hypothetical protein
MFATDYGVAERPPFWAPRRRCSCKRSHEFAGFDWGMVPTRVTLAGALSFVVGWVQPTTGPSFTTGGLLPPYQRCAVAGVARYRSYSTMPLIPASFKVTRVVQNRTSYVREGILLDSELNPGGAHPNRARHGISAPDDQDALSVKSVTFCDIV